MRLYAYWAACVSSSKTVALSVIPLAILNEEIEHEAWFAEFLAQGPSGHFRRRRVGESPFVSKFLHP